MITMPLLVWFIGGWLVPQKHLPNAFLWFTYVAVLFQVLCTWLPEVGGWKTTVHRMLTGISGATMLLLVIMLATALHLPVATRLSAWIALAFMIFLLASALHHQKGYKWALLLQICYYVAFFIVLLLATYLS